MFFDIFFVCFFNDTATTEIYTYGHTLSLHDALPICKVPEGIPNPEILAEDLHKPLTVVRDPFGSHDSFGAHNNARLRAFLDSFGFEYEFRSEEHTSELQSLMRISYAVFCLKKKKIKHNITK